MYARLCVCLSVSVLFVRVSMYVSECKCAGVCVCLLVSMRLNFAYVCGFACEGLIMYVCVGVSRVLILVVCVRACVCMGL